ncbi:MAG: hypothetical protein IT371_30345 [Deltaproteobacteria bacterium]|nr:hypothetical protein [Deltaproteobacteria bacterium]
MSSKKVEGTKRSDVTLFDPKSLVLVGQDKLDVYGQDHPLYQKRVNRAINWDRVVNMLVQGFTSVIRVVKDAKTGDHLVQVGRGRTQDARKANEVILKAIEAKATCSTSAQIAEVLTREFGHPIGEAVVRAMLPQPLWVAATIVRGDDAKLFAQARAENNLFDGADDAYQQALDMDHYLKITGGADAGVTIEDVAAHFGVSVSTAKNRMKVLDATPEVREALGKGEITWSDAVRMAGLEEEQQKQVLLLTPKKNPAEPKKRRKGVRGKNRRPSKRTIQKVVEHLGEGHEAVRWLWWVLGVDGAEESLVKRNKSLASIFDEAAKPKRKKQKKEG